MARGDEDCDRRCKGCLHAFTAAGEPLDASPDFEAIAKAIPRPKHSGEVVIFMSMRCYAALHDYVDGRAPLTIPNLMAALHSGILVRHDALLPPDSWEWYTDHPDCRCDECLSARAVRQRARVKRDRVARELLLGGSPRPSTPRLPWPAIVEPPETDDPGTDPQPS